MPRYRVTVTYEEKVEARSVDDAEAFMREDVEHGRYAPVAVDVEVVRHDK